MSDFESSEVTRLVGVTPIYLNTFVERRQYGITPSVRTGKGRGRRRRFSEEDLFGIALVWWLFEAGLRSQAIQEVLNEICDGRPKSPASEAAKRLKERRRKQFMVIEREPRWVEDQERDYPKLKLRMVEAPMFALMPASVISNLVIIIPMGRLLSLLEKNIEALQQTIQGG